MRNVCTFNGPVEEKYLHVTAKLNYGWSVPPEKTERKHFYYTAGSALVEDNYVDYSPPTNLYYTCVSPDGKSGVVNSSINAKWVTERDKQTEDAMIVKVLLIAAQKMRAELGCVNELDLSPDAEVEVVVDTPGGMKAGLPLPRVPESGPVQR